MRTLGGIIFALSMTFVGTLPAQGSGFTVTPMIQEVVLDEGNGTSTYTVTVTNETGAIATLEISALDFGSLDESGGVAFLGTSGVLDQKYALASWIQPETDTLTLESKEERSIEVRIENSGSLAPGGHYAALVFKTVSPVKPDVPNVAINQIFSSLVLVKKTGGARYGLDLVSVEQAGNWFSFGPTVSPRFKNSGNVHVTPRGVVRVTDVLGRLVYRGILNEGSSIVLPETFREFPFKLSSVGRAFIPGPYTLTLQYRYDGKDDPETWSRQTLYFPPLATLLTLACGVGLVGALVYRRHRKRPSV